MTSAFRISLRRMVRVLKVSADSSDAIFIVDNFGRSFDISYSSQIKAIWKMKTEMDVKGERENEHKEVTRG